MPPKKPPSSKSKKNPSTRTPKTAQKQAPLTNYGFGKTSVRDAGRQKKRRRISGRGNEEDPFELEDEGEDLDWEVTRKEDIPETQFAGFTPEGEELRPRFGTAEELRPMFGKARALGMAQKSAENQRPPSLFSASTRNSTGDTLTPHHPSPDLQEQIQQLPQEQLVPVQKSPPEPRSPAQQPPPEPHAPTQHPPPSTAPIPKTTPPRPTHPPPTTAPPHHQPPSNPPPAPPPPESHTPIPSPQTPKHTRFGPAKEIPSSQSPLESPLKTQVTPRRFEGVWPSAPGWFNRSRVVKSSQWYENDDTQGSLDTQTYLNTQRDINTQRNTITEKNIYTPRRNHPEKLDMQKNPPGLEKAQMNYSEAESEGEDGMEKGRKESSPLSEFDTQRLETEVEKVRAKESVKTVSQLEIEASQFQARGGGMDTGRNTTPTREAPKHASQADITPRQAQHQSGELTTPGSTIRGTQFAFPPPQHSPFADGPQSQRDSEEMETNSSGSSVGETQYAFPQQHSQNHTDDGPSSSPTAAYNRTPSSFHRPTQSSFTSFHESPRKNQTSPLVKGTRNKDPPQINFLIGPEASGPHSIPTLQDLDDVSTASDTGDEEDEEEPDSYLNFRPVRTQQFPQSMYVSPPPLPQSPAPTQLQPQSPAGVSQSVGRLDLDLDLDYPSGDEDLPPLSGEEQWEDGEREKKKRVVITTSQLLPDTLMASFPPPPPFTQSSSNVGYGDYDDETQ